MELDGTTALVTGGAGLIGSTLVDQLIDAGVGCDPRARQLRPGTHGQPVRGPARFDLEVIDGDIRDPRDPGTRRPRGADVVFHLAAIRITQCAEEPRLALETLVDGTFNVAEAAVAAGVDKVVFSSSASVYGDADVLPTTEDHHPYNNRTFYGAAKSFGEQMLRLVQRDVRPRLGRRCGTSTCTGRGWTSTVCTPRCWCGGWSGSSPASRR